MDKKIILTMQDNKDISVKVNNKEKFIISHDNRSINANDIFELLEYSSGDSYLVNIVNEKKRDVVVIQFFSELLKDIISKLSEPEVSIDNDITEEELPF